MARVQAKIEVLKDQIANLEMQLGTAEDKLDRQSFKRRRKAFRKKMVKDPVYQVMARIEREMYEPCHEEQSL